jgi:hypothetical protein
VAQPAELNACKAFYSDELGEFLLRYEAPTRDGNAGPSAPENLSRSLVTVSPVTRRISIGQSAAGEGFPSGCLW